MHNLAPLPRRSAPASRPMRPRRRSEGSWRSPLVYAAGALSWALVFRCLVLAHVSSRRLVPEPALAARRALRAVDSPARCAETFSVGGRDVHLWLPSDGGACDDGSGGPRPLVVYLHGFGGDPRMWAPAAGRAAQRGWLAVAPAGSDRSWNADFCCGPALSKRVDDVAFLENVVAAVRARARVKSVFGVGFSNGGFMLGKAVNDANIFDAVSPWSGHAYLLAGNATPTPVFMNHGLRDGVVRFAGCCGGARCCCGIDDRWPRACRPTSSLFDDWRRLNHCGPGVRRTRDDARVSCDTALGCAANTTLCVHKNLAHEVPGLRPRPGRERPAVTIDASLDFFAGLLDAAPGG